MKFGPLPTLLILTSNPSQSINRQEGGLSHPLELSEKGGVYNDGNNEVFRGTAEGDLYRVPNLQLMPHP